MSFLNNTGLAYFYSKLKEKFIQKVNGTTPDVNGNVQINQVPLAENLTSPDAQASIDKFIYRTSGGSASLDSGEANLVFINGNIEIFGRVDEDWSATTTNNISCNINNIDKTTWRGQVSVTGDTTFTYSVTMNTSAQSSWSSSGTWNPSLATYGLGSGVISNIIDYSINCVVTSETGITAATVIPSTFSATTLAQNSGSYNFTYIDFGESEEPTEEESGWYYNGDLVTLSSYGITATGTPVNGDIITIDWLIGTPNNSTVVIHYIAPVQGTLLIAKPTAFQSTGFNQFDKNSMVINNATISGTQIIADDNYSICYCPAKSGDHGYAAVSPGEHIIDTAPMGWSATIPDIGDTIITTSINPNDVITNFAGRFTANEDGYILVVVDNVDDIMMGCAWSDYISDIQEELSADPSFYKEYSIPSQIPIPMYGYNNNIRYELPTATYGLPRIGTYYDTINFDAHTYVKRVGYYPYSAENLAIVQDYYATYGTPYEYDEGTNGKILYALDGNSGVGNPVIYQLEETGSYTAATGVVTSVDIEQFITNALPNILNYDRIIHDKYVFTNTGIGETYWSYSWNDGTSHSQVFNFVTNWGVTFGTVTSGDTLTIYIPIESIYQVDDHGTEKIINTEIPVQIELLYGQNLRDKLRTDVLTISEQELYPSQILQVLKNQGWTVANTW